MTPPADPPGDHGNVDTSSQGHPTRARTSQGRFVPAAGTAERDGRACRLRTLGMTYAQIATELGFRDKSAARKAVYRALAAAVQEPARELRALEEERLDDLIRHLQRVLAVPHYAVTASGKVAMHPETDEPLIDHGPVVAAALALLRVSESRRKLLGLDAPTRHEVTTIDDVDRQLRELADQVDGMGR